MHEVEQAQLLNIQGRFLRSTHIERDWHDPSALQDYVVTQHAKQSIARLAAGLTPASGLRAWRITGDYGSGKSSFALLLANLLSDRRQQLPIALQAAVAPALQSVDTVSLPLRPVLVTGSREPLGLAIVRSLYELLLALPEPPAKLVVKLYAAVSKGFVSDAQVIKWVEAVHALVLEGQLARGLLLVLDEVGKFLEFAALHPERQDIYLLQGLAELAARSGPAPLMIVVLMHQGISGYAENLTQTQQREWEKIAGRYEELSWHHPLEQVAELISNALNTDLTEAPRQAPLRAKRDMQDALRLRWYGTASHQKSLLDIAARLYPLHPTVLPVLVRLFATFGQNERSLFSFLLGSEPFGLLDFVERTEGRDFFRIAHLYDYARQAFNQRLSLQSFRNHWKAIDGIVSSYRGEDPLELGLLKTIGLLNVLDAEDLLATNEALELALRGSEDVKAAIQRLKAQHLLYYRGAAGGYSLWPHTSVNLDTVYNEATREIGSLQKVAGLVRDRLEARPLVARRHYIRTGTLRFFEVAYVAVDALADHVRAPLTADGRILVPLCETPEEEARALAFAQTELTQPLAQVLIAVPQPLQGLAPILAEVLRWEWIQRNVPELQHDSPARDATATQLALAQQRLAEHLQRYVGMTNATAESGLRWFRQGTLLPTVKSGPEVMTLLTTVLDEVFHSAPLIHNELVNRASPSSAAAAARGRLCEHLFETPSEPYLGMDATKTPPEMSMYLSVLKEAKLHVFDPKQQTWSLQLPAAEHDSLRVLPAFQRIGEVLRESSDARVPATEIYAALQHAPYGVREGMIPLLLAIFSVINEQELAYYEDDTFIPRITGSNFFRLTKAPETFDIQFYPISGVRTGLFQSLIQHLKLSGKQPARVDLLDVVKPLLTFVAGLPAYTLKTSRLAPQTKAVRALLMTARDPATLLFHALPQACDLPPIKEESSEQNQTVEQFALALKTAIDELRGAHPALLHWIKERLQEEFLLHGTFEQVRQALAPRAASVAGFVTEPRLKSFCLRLADTNLSETMWLESLGNLVCAMPPAKWKDADVHKYEQEIHHLAAQFARVEAIVYNRSKFKGTVEGESVRIALTQPTGQERKKVIHLTPEEVKDANELQDVITGLLRDKGLVGMAAASRALWQLLSTTEPTATETEQEIS